MARPYVYRCEHKITKRFYIGYRQANILPAMEDLGIHYFTSCREVQKNFSEFTYEILSEYDSAMMAYEVEQVLLYNLRDDPLLINGNNFRTRNHIALDPKPVVLENTLGYKDRKKLLGSYLLDGKRKRSENYKPSANARKRKRKRDSKRNQLKG